LAFPQLRRARTFSAHYATPENTELQIAETLKEQAT